MSNYTITPHQATFVARLDGVEIARGSSYLSADAQAQPLLATIEAARSELAALRAECSKIGAIVTTALSQPAALNTYQSPDLWQVRTYLLSQGYTPAFPALAHIEHTIEQTNRMYVGKGARNHRRRAKNRRSW